MENGHFVASIPGVNWNTADQGFRSAETLPLCTSASSLDFLVGERWLHHQRLWRAGGTLGGIKIL